MESILIGLLGFAFFAGADWATYKKIPLLKPFLWFGIFPVSCYAMVMAWVRTEHFPFPDILSTLAWIPFTGFLMLFFYSLYIEIPVKKTYIDSSQPKRVVTDGTYALCRHPAAIWYIGWMVSAVFVSKSLTLAAATPIWTAAYVCCILLEDKLSSLGDFGEEYKEYQKTTPMLIPNRKSIGRFFKGLNRYGEGNGQ